MAWTRVGCLLAGVSGAAALLPSGPVHAQASPFVGLWHLDVAQSKPAPGETAPADLTTRIDRVDTQHVRWTTTTTDGRGQKDVETFDNPGNGEFYSLNGYTMVSHRVSAGALQSTYRDDRGQTDTLTCMLSADARQMTCNGMVTHQDGSVVRYTDVFDRM